MPNDPNKDLVALLSAFSPITLGEMDSVRLMNRVDTKYVTTEDTLYKVLSDAAARGYKVLDVEGVRLSPYNSMYFDTPSLKMFTDHATRRLTRQKVRTRVYSTTGLTFLEIKRKNNRGRTKKKRFEIPGGEFFDFRDDAAAAEFLALKSDYTASAVEPQMETLFDRITLVNPSMTERVTMDTNLRFVNHVTGKDASLGKAVIIEVKQDGLAASEMKTILLQNRVKTLRVSKYCIGTSLTNPAARSNRFKLKIRRINKICSES